MPKLTDQPALTSLADNDLAHVVDVSDTTSGAAGTSKKITYTNIFAQLLAAPRTMSANLNFSGNGLKITGDFSNATRANRFAFQTSTLNGNTRVPILPNGTSRLAGIDLHDGTDLDNSSFLQVHSDGTNNHAGLNSTKVGTGTTKDLVFQIDGVTKAKVNAADGKFNVDTLTPSLMVGTDASKNLQSVTVATSSVGTDFAANYSGATLTLSIPNAGTGIDRGLITNLAQTIAGVKTFSDEVMFDKPTATFANLQAFTSTVSSATPVVLTRDSTYLQIQTGTAFQTFTLPVASTLQVGFSFKFINNGTSNNLGVFSSGGGVVASVIPGTSGIATCILASGTTNASWRFEYLLPAITGTGTSIVTNVGPTITGAMTFSGTAGSNSAFGTAITTGTIGIGGTAGTGTITVGQSTASQTTNIQAGATASGSTKAINIGTGGLAGSTTDINIGSIAGTSAITLNADTSATNPTAAPSGSSSPGKQFISTGQIWNSGLGTRTMAGSIQVMAHLPNANPTISKLSFLVGTDNAAPTEKMYITSSGLFNINGGATFAGANLNDASNAVYIQNLAAATSSVPQASNKLFLQGKSWNTALGNSITNGYIQAVTAGNNTSPTVEGLNFAPGSGAGIGTAATQLFAMTNQGRFGIGTITPTESLDVVGNARVQGILKQLTYTVATLPSASTSGVGARSFVTDALAPVFGATVAGGGAVPVPVYSDGTNWKVG